jgi:hypothetical protein
MITMRKDADDASLSIAIEQVMRDLSEHAKNKNFAGILQLFENIGFNVGLIDELTQLPVATSPLALAIAVPLAAAISKLKLYACEDKHVRKVVSMIWLQSATNLINENNFSNALSYILQGARLLDELFPAYRGNDPVPAVMDHYNLQLDKHENNQIEIITSVINQFKNLEKKLSYTRCQFIFSDIYRYLTSQWRDNSTADNKDRRLHAHRLLTFWKNNPNLEIHESLRNWIALNQLGIRHITVINNPNTFSSDLSNFVKVSGNNSLNNFFPDYSITKIGNLLVDDDNDIMLHLIICMIHFSQPESEHIFVETCDLLANTWRIYTQTPFYNTQTFHERFLQLVKHATAYITTTNSLMQNEKDHLYTKLLGILPAILDDTSKKLRGKPSLTYFNFMDHNTLLLLITGLCINLNRQGEAAQYLYDQAHLLRTICPEITLRYAIMGQRRFKLLPHTSDERADLYYLMAEVLFKQNRLNKAIATLEKACALLPNNEWQELLDKWRLNRNELISIMDIDLYSEWQRILNLRNSVQEAIFKATSDGDSPEKVKNLNTIIFVKLSTMLDQAFSRFVQTCIYEPSGIQTAVPLYFPVIFSKTTLDKILESNKILCTNQIKLLEPKDLSLDLYRFNNQVMLKDALIKLIYDHFKSDDKTNKTVKITKTHLHNLPFEWLPYQTEIDALLTKLMADQANKEFVFDKQVLGKTCNIAKIDFTLKPLATVQHILAVLMKRGWLEVFSGGKYKLTSKFDLNLFLQEFSADFGDAQARLIQERLKVALSMQNTKSIHTDFPEIYEAIQAAQPNSYFDPSKNSANRQHFANEWLFSLNEISINSKHLYLTPQQVSTKKLSNSGIVSNTEINQEIDVFQLRPTYHRGSFIHLFNKMNLSDQELLTLSSELYTFLKSKNFITRISHQDTSFYREEKLTHPLLEEYLARHLRCASALELSAVKEKLFIEIVTLLKHHPYLRGYETIINEFLILRKLQEGFILPKADQKVDVERLLNNSLDGVLHLVKLMGKSRHRQLNYPTLSAPLSKPNLLPFTDKNDALKSLVKTDITLADLQQIHLFIKQYAKHATPSAIADLYFEAAKRLSNTAPWLAIQYYNQCVNIDNLYLGEFKLEFRSAKFFLLRSLNMDQRAHKPLGFLVALDAVNSNTWARFYKHPTSVESKYPSIFSQLNHLKKDVCNLNYMAFKLTLNYDNQALLEETQNAYAEACIKLRHLLDQALSYFARDCLFHPNDELIAEAHFPCAENESELRRLLASSSIDMDILSKEFPDVINCISNMQPYQVPDANSHYTTHAWLQRLLSITNEAKHDTLNIISSSKLQEWVNQHDLNAHFPICYSERRLFPWSFTDVSGINWQTSSIIYNTFTRLKQLGFKYKNDRATYSAQLDILKQQLQDKLNDAGISTLTNTQLNDIACIFIASEEQKLPISDRITNSTRMIAANHFVACVLDQVDKAVNILLNQKPYVKPRISSASSNSSSPSITPSISRTPSPKI